LRLRGGGWRFVAAIKALGRSKLTNEDRAFIDKVEMELSK